MKTETIRSVGDYINKLEKRGMFRRAFYRGESKKFRTPLTAAALRNYRISHRVMYNSFYREVHLRLTANEKEHFIAFCQHHGIPTNLLDVTSNPLIALFFSCCSDFKNDGYVYLFDSQLLDVTKFIDSLKLEDEYENRLNFLFCEKRHQAFICKMLSNTINTIENIKPPIVSDIKKIIEDINNGVDNFNFQDIDFEEIVEFLPLSIYSPLLSFDRAVSQKSSFIYQWHSLDNKQIIRPDHVYRIPSECKDNIKENLDVLNINRATIFQDFDNIAEYIKGKSDY
ncbi:MAG: FRG domain-containing protein [Ruminococcus sp.]|jgi:hypothetical protein|nr:FRG domain-containing protein [Ruminococcus sp.]